MSKISRRKFLYAGVAAAAGIGYLTKDYWLPSPEPIISPSPTTTPITTQSTQPTIKEIPPTLTETQTSVPTEPTTTTEEMSEEEQQIRDFLIQFRDLYAAQDARIANLYTDDAWHSWYTLNAGNEIHKDKHEIHSFYYWNFLKGKMGIQPQTFQITNITISEDKKQINVIIGGQNKIASLAATASCHCNWGYGGAWCCRATSDFLLVYIPKASPHITGKDDVWKIKNEQTKILRIG